MQRFLDETAGPAGPIAGEGFREWSDRLREVEEMLDDPELRSEVARIRDRARGMRVVQTAASASRLASSPRPVGESEGTGGSGCGAPG